MTLKYNFNDDDYEYDIDWIDIRCALKTILKNKSREDILDLLLDLVSDCDVEDYFEEDLIEYFEYDAREAYDDAVLYERDPYSYYGLSISDFI